MPADIMPKHMRDSICPGCATYAEVGKVREIQNQSGYTDSPQCAIKPYYRGKTCPCSKCLIKMVCEDTCDRMDDYRNWCGDIKYARPLP